MAAPRVFIAITVILATLAASTSSAAARKVPRLAINTTELRAFHKSHTSLTHHTAGAAPRRGDPTGGGNGLATYYGGYGGSGTERGNCGYGALQNLKGLGTNIAAAATYFYAGGAACGGCYKVGKDTITKDASNGCYCPSPRHQIQCVNNKFCRGGPITVTITDQCPTCDWAMHFDLSKDAFTKIADPVAGRVQINWQRVNCGGYGGIAIIPQGNQWWISFLIRNVNGPGALNKVEVATCDKCNFNTLNRAWGSNFVYNPPGQWNSLTFRLTGSNNQRITLNNCVPNNWRAGRAYYCNGNF